jgi:hypothetical protein
VPEEKHSRWALSRPFEIDLGGECGLDRCDFGVVRLAADGFARVVAFAGFPWAHSLGSGTQIFANKVPIVNDENG